MSRRARALGLLLVGAAIGAVACVPAEGSEAAKRQARSTLVVGIDVSQSFQKNESYSDALDFAAFYIYAHINGLGGAKKPTALFVGSIGGERPGEAKSFQPIHTFQGKSVPEIAEYLRDQFPSRDGYTDFNPFFARVATLVQRQGLVLAPLEVVLFSDGIPDAGAGSGRPARHDTTRYERINLEPLEYLSRSVTVRLLYPEPTVAVQWERQVPRQRVRMWTVDHEVMKTWQHQLQPGVVPDGQVGLYKWIADNVDFRVRSKGIL